MYIHGPQSGQSSLLAGSSSPQGSQIHQAPHTHIPPSKLWAFGKCRFQTFFTAMRHPPTCAATHPPRFLTALLSLFSPRPLLVLNGHYFACFCLFLPCWAGLDDDDDDDDGVDADCDLACALSGFALHMALQFLTMLPYCEKKISDDACQRHEAAYHEAVQVVARRKEGKNE